MFEQYGSIADLVKAQGLNRLREELNSSSLYVVTVRVLGYREIGLNIMSTNSGIARYSSFHDRMGRIEEIRADHLRPDILVRAEEKVLLQILARVDEIRTHPLRETLRYAPHFRPERPKDYLALTTILGIIPRLLVRRTSAHSQFPG